MSRPTVAEIDLSALGYNLDQIRNLLQGKAEILAIVKADAYGHGAGPIAHELASAGVRFFGVATAEEGIALRQAKIIHPILILGGIYPGEFQKYLRNHLTPAIFDLDSAQRIEKKAKKAISPFPVHLKIDTGMTRLGFAWDRWETTLEFFKEAKFIQVEGLMTHLAVAESERPDDKAFTEEQIRRFQTCVVQIHQAGLSPRFIHVANSSATAVWEKARFNLVRPGLMLYGALPSSALGNRISLKPVLSLKTKILSIKAVRGGESVSYGRTFICPKDSLIATLPIGYADGYSRRFSNRAEVLVKGRRARVAGVVCMDLTMIDVSEIPEVRVGDEVVLLGKQGSDEIPVSEVARWAETIPYEIFCGISKRVPRHFIRDSS